MGLQWTKPNCLEKSLGMHGYRMKFQILQRPIFKYKNYLEKHWQLCNVHASNGCKIKTVQGLDCQFYFSPTSTSSRRPKRRHVAISPDLVERGLHVGQPRPVLHGDVVPPLRHAVQLFMHPLLHLRVQHHQSQRKLKKNKVEKTVFNFGKRSAADFFLQLSA
jgi:hypothetical protein